MKIIQTIILYFIYVINLHGEDTLPYDFNNNKTQLTNKINVTDDNKSNGRIKEINGFVMPVGAILPYGGLIDKIPEGWILCDGKSYSIEKYKDLYQTISSSFGSIGDGYFNVPDLRGMFLRGVDFGAGRDPDAILRKSLQAGGNSGDTVGSYQVDALKDHKHEYYDAINVSNGCVGLSGGGGCFNSTNYSREINKTEESSGAINEGAEETRPINVSVHFIIRY